MLMTQPASHLMHCVGSLESVVTEDRFDRWAGWGENGDCAHKEGRCLSP